MINIVKNKIKSFLNLKLKLPTHKKWNSRELSQKRICENWSVIMLAEYYNVNEYYMREILDFYNIK